jgi:hypothetical protein
MAKHTSGPSKSASRPVRLAKALRANLKRRKAQAKSRAQAEADRKSPENR